MYEAVLPPSDTPATIQAAGNKPEQQQLRHPTPAEVFDVLRKSGQEEAYTKAIQYSDRTRAGTIYHIIIALNKGGGRIADGIIFDLVRAVARGGRGTWNPDQLRNLHLIAGSRPKTPTWAQPRHLPALGPVH